MIKAIFLDIDGTLLNNHNQISYKNIIAIKHIQKYYNIHVFLATGRPPQDMINYYNQLNLYTPAICMNGSYILDLNKNSVIKEETIPLNIVKLFKYECNKYHISTIFYINSYLITDYINPDINYEIYNSSHEIQIIPFEKMIKNCYKNNNAPHKIGIISQNQEILTYISFNFKKKFNQILNIHRSQSNFIEVINFNVSKARAISFLNKFYQFKKENILTIGDSDNDISMIKLAGIGIAMGNAKQYIKNIANDVTLNNYEDGVAHAIEKYIIYNNLK